MNLTNSEKGELIFKDVKNSYTFWAIKKAVKDEVVKGRGKPSDIQEQIPLSTPPMLSSLWFPDWKLLPSGSDHC